MQIGRRGTKCSSTWASVGVRTVGVFILIHCSLTENSPTMHLDLKRHFAQFKDTALCLQLAFS